MGLLLQSGVVKDSALKEMLDTPEEYVESTDFFSWEQFFTHVLVEKTENTYLKYSKRVLNPVYLHENVKTQILESISN